MKTVTFTSQVSLVNYAMLQNELFIFKMMTTFNQLDIAPFTKRWTIQGKWY